MNNEHTLNQEHGNTLTSTGALRVAEEHAKACWAALENHARGGRCTCHMDADGSIHLLNACYIGRSLNEEYWIAARRVRHLSGQLKFGDMESTVEAVRS